MSTAQLISKIESLRSRLRVLSVGFGVGLSVVAAIGLVLALCSLDYFLNLPSGFRAILLLGAISLLVVALWRWVIRPAGTRISLTDVAGRLEQVFPQFDDRLRSTVNFAHTADLPGSEIMKEKVVEEAARIASTTDLSSALQSRPMWTSLLGAVLAVAMLVGIGAAVGKNVRDIALNRLFNPLSQMRWPRSVQISILGEVPRKIPAGQELVLKIRLEKGDRAGRKPLVYYSIDGGPEQSEFMTRQADGTFTTGIKPRSSTDGAGILNVRVAAGDDEEELPSIQIVPVLQLRSVQAIVTPPAYTKQPATTINLVQSTATIVARSKVQLSLGFSKPLDAQRSLEIISVNPDRKAPAIVWDRTTPGSPVGTFIATESCRFRVRGTDDDGFSNAGIEEYELIVRPDQMPSVTIENPRRNEERTPEATIPVRLLCEDDFGIQSLSLRIMRLSDKKPWAINLVQDGTAANDSTFEAVGASTERKRFAAGMEWELAKLADAKLQSGDVLEYYAEATDNCKDIDLTHPPVQSSRLRITIISQDEFRARVAEELRIASYQIGEIDKAQNRTKQETEDLKNDTKDKPNLDAGDKAVAERLASRQATSAAQTKALAARLENVLNAIKENKSTAEDLKATAREVADILDKTAEKPMKDSAGDLNDFRQPASRDERNARIDDATAKQKDASDNLRKAMEKLGNVGTLSQAIDTIKSLLADQQRLSAETADIGKRNLGKRPEQMSAEDRKKLEKTAKEQADLAKKTEKAINDLEKQADQMSKTNPQDSDAMKQAAATGKSQQVPQNQSKAASAAQQNQQSSAQSAQKQAELGLEMILNQLKEAERRKLEELVRKLEELQKQVDNLVRRQAGHNLDDLGLQGPDVLKKLDTKVLDALIEKSQRVKDQFPPIPTMSQLTAAQEQTERNTRDIADMAESLPKGAEIGTNLTRAAEKMQRAVVFLRDAKLLEAYDPPMVEALAALDSAKKMVDEQKREADKKQEEQQKEAIKAVYERVRAEQVKINIETTRIDGSPRGADGSLKREDSVRLGQLPSEQGKLHDELKKLEEPLGALGSIVYVWANKDLTKAMASVKDSLAKPATGKPTQAEQKRILKQLDAMIANLSIKPPKEDFEQKGGGGGGNGQPPARIPSEAELRMLKDLQLGVNDATVDAHTAAQKDNQQLLSIGNRQGEIREVLDKLLEQASRGKIKLRPEPDNKDQLPEEATAEDVEDQELATELLKEKPDPEKAERDALLVGDRMARSRQRMAINHDPGKVTQIIQQRIIKDLDLLIEQARKNSAQGSPKPGQGKPQQAKQPQPNQGQPNAGKGQPPPTPSGQTPAQASNSGPNNARPADLSKEIVEKLSEWGGITPRQRAAILEGASETVVEKYRKLIDDYYRTLATKGTEKR